MKKNNRITNWKLIIKNHYQYSKIYEEYIKDGEPCVKLFADNLTKKNAELICKCVNEHEPLLNSLQECLKVIKPVTTHFK